MVGLRQHLCRVNVRPIIVHAGFGIRMNQQYADNKKHSAKQSLPSFSKSLKIQQNHPVFK